MDVAGTIAAAARSTPGFLSEAEGERLTALARRATDAALGPLVEVGSYLGRSSLFLAAGVAAAAIPGVLFSIDHHHGSEELQAGWADHDPALVDSRTGRIDTLPRWRAAIERAGADGIVVGIVGESATIARAWRTPLALCFIDGGHGAEVCWADYRGWAPQIAPGGILAFHDVYPDPADGGRPPYECYLDAIGSGHFTESTDDACGSLRVLVRSVEKTAEVAAPPESRSDASRTAAAE